MPNVKRWWTRLTAVLATAVLSVFVPAAAWAADNDVVLEAAKRSKSKGLGSFVVIGGVLCCLLVVGAIVLAIVLIMKKKRK